MGDGVNLENILLSEINETERQILYDLNYMRNLGPSNCIERRAEVTRGWHWVREA